MAPIISENVFMSPSYQNTIPPTKPPDLNLVDIVMPKQPSPIHENTIRTINHTMVNSTDSKNETNFLMLVNDFSDYFYGNSSSPLSARNGTVSFNELFNYNNCSINGTVICVDKDSSERNYWALVLLVFPVLTLFGNVLVIMSVVRERALQTVTNYFIVSLAVADLMVAVIVMPFGVYYLWNGSWGLPAFVCDVYIAMDVTSSTSSIFNLVAISVDRYIAVTKPIKYAKHKNNTRVWLTIVMVWAISAAIGAPIVLGLNDTPDRNYNECLFNSQNYVIYSSLGSFYIPCIMMMFLYYNIFRALNDRLKKQRAAKRPPVPSNAGTTTAVVIENVAQTRRFAETSLHDDRPTNTGSGSNEEERDDSFDRNSVDLEAGADDCHVIPNDRSTDFMLATVEEETTRRPRGSPVVGDPNGNNDSGYVPSNVDEIVREATPPGSPGMRDATVLRNLAYKSSLRKNGRFGQQSSRNASVTLHHEDETSKVKIVDSPTKERKASSATSRFTIYKANKASKKKREKSSAKKERKATKTLAIVLGVFLCCWGPFFSCNMADAVHGKFNFGFSPGVTLFMVTTWLGYINSFVNPVIYTIFNPEFRKAFRKSLRCGP